LSPHYYQPHRPFSDVIFSTLTGTACFAATTMVIVTTAKKNKKVHFEQEVKLGDSTQPLQEPSTVSWTKSTEGLMK